MGCNHLRLLAFVLASWRVHPFESMTKAMLDIFIAAAILSPLSPIASQSPAEGVDDAGEAYVEQEVVRKEIHPPSPQIKVRAAPAEQDEEDAINAQPSPVADTLPWITQADYPPESWSAGEEGGIEYEIAVSKAGELEGCEVVYSSGYERLDAFTCDLLLERAKLAPGVDAQGNPVGGSYVGYLTWYKSEPRLQDSYKIAVRFTLDERGEETNCEVLEVTADLPPQIKESFERDPCPRSTIGEDGVPYRDVNGVPIAKQVTVMVEVRLDDIPE